MTAGFDMMSKMKDHAPEDFAIPVYPAYFYVYQAFSTTVMNLLTILPTILVSFHYFNLVANKEKTEQTAGNNNPTLNENLSV